MSNAIINNKAFDKGFVLTDSALRSTKRGAGCVGRGIKFLGNKVYAGLCTTGRSIKGSGVAVSSFASGVKYAVLCDAIPVTEIEVTEIKVTKPRVRKPRATKGAKA